MRITKYALGLPALNVFLIASALTLVGCGGGSGGSGGPSAEDGGVFQQAVAVDEENAEAVAGAVNDAVVTGGGSGDPFSWTVMDGAEDARRFDARSFALEQVRKLPKPGLYAAETWDEACYAGGRVVATWNESGSSIQLTLRFENCDDGYGEVLNGSVAIKGNWQHIGGDNYSFSSTVELNNLRVTYHDSRPSESINGVLTMSGTENDGTGQISGTQKGWLIARSGDMYWGMKDLDLIFSQSYATYEWTMTINSLKVGDSTLGGFVSVKTITPVEGSLSATCPHSGEVEVTGPDGTIRIVYGTPVSVYLNNVLHSSPSSCTGI